jgi:TonB family protein
MRSSNTALAAPSLYGAFELKRYYQRGALMGVGIAAAVHLLIVAGVLLYPQEAVEEIDGPVKRVIIVDEVTDLSQPPSILAEEIEPTTADRILKELTAGTPVAVPDAEVVEEPNFPTRLERALLSQADATGMAFGEGDSVVIAFNPEEIFPQPEEFVAYQEEPVPIVPVQPVYPEIAGLTEKSGDVWIRALIDKTGHVRDARILKPSGTKVGFEEAALAAALKAVYRPAIQNGQPVAVWISYKVEFRFQQ